MGGRGRHHRRDHRRLDRLQHRAAVRHAAVRAARTALPKHFGTGHVALAKQLFARWGGAVFFGRFIALLRILAGPLAGALHMRYPYFLAANASGAVFWAGGTTAVVYFLGLAAEKWLARFSWVALVAALIIGVTMTLLLKERTRSLIAQLEAEHDWGIAAPGAMITGPRFPVRRS